MKKISSLIFSIALIFCLLPIRVFADVLNYVNVPTSKTNISGQYYWNENSGESGVRAVCLYDGSTYFTYFVRQGSYGYVRIYYPGSYGNMGYRTYYNGYYVGNVDNSYSDLINWNNAFKEKYGFINAAHTNENAVYYTFGAGSSSPDPTPTPTPVVYGNLINVGYNTKIAGNGDAAINNLDRITWNSEQDANGNDISEMSVTIRAVPGKYSAQTSQSILEQLYSNFVLDTLHVSELDTVNASDGSFSVTWNDVVHEFDLLGIPGFWFATKDTIKDPEGGYIKRGWIYQIRLEGEDFTGDWQTVYTATSSGVQNDLTIVNSSTINQTLINSITEINNLNNTENNWYINNTTINMGEYSDPGSSGKPWWAYLLEAIVSLLNGVIDAIANLVGSIIDGLLGLFSFDSFSIPDFTTNKQTIKQNSGIFGESIDLLQGINNTLSNADGTAEPILYYPGLELMGEEFIPEITINLNTYVSDLGLTEWHNLAYVCTDAMIWISLIYTIYKKLIGVFKK